MEKHLIGNPFKMCYNVFVFIKSRKVQLILILVFLLLPGNLTAQTVSGTRLFALHMDAFPIVSAYLDVRDSQSLFIPGLQGNNIQLFEDQEIVQFATFEEIRPGAQIAIAFNPGTAFAIRDGEGITRYDYLTQQIANWMGQEEVGVDDLSFVVPGSVLSLHDADPAEIFASWEAYQPDFDTAIPSLEVLSSAIDVALDSPSHEGMQPVVVFLTPTLPLSLNEILASITERAIASGVTVHVVLVDSPLLFESPSAQGLQNLANLTGGRLFAFPGEGTVIDINTWLEYSRRLYHFSYHSNIHEAGIHTLSANVFTNQGEVIGEVFSFEVDVQPPNPIFLDPPLEIIRSIPDGIEIAVENLEPRQYTIEIVLDFPDGMRRDIVRTSLYANGELAAENTVPPFEYFTIDLTVFDLTDQVVFQVEAEDVQGMVGVSRDVPVNIVVDQPDQGILPTLARNGTIIAVAAVGLAGIVLLFVLVLAGRIRPQPLGQRRKQRAAYEDPVTQPIRAVEASIPQAPSPLAQITRRLPSPKLPWAQRRPQKEALAYLLRINEDGSVEPGKVVTIQAREVTFGSDAGKSIVQLDDPGIEGVHARIWRDDEGIFHLADESSVAGTWLNYAPISNEGCQVEHGDLIHIGKVGFRFSLSRPTQPKKPVVVKIDKDTL